MDQLKSLLPSVLKKKGYFDAAMASLLVKRANERIDAVCGDLSGHIRAVSVKDGILHLSADHQLILTEFQQYKAEMLSFLAEEFPESVKDITIRRR